MNISLRPALLYSEYFAQRPLNQAGLGVTDEVVQSIVLDK
jgi:hypothetical protein